MSVLGETVNDGWVVTKRNLLKIKRIPDLLIFSTIQPIMFVLLFAYVFGGAIATPGVNYREFLMPGIFVQTVAFGAGITAIGLADDLQKGIVDRFRSLPMSRAAVLLGRTTSDLLNNVFVVAVMAITGLIVGWRIHEGFLRGVAGFLILFLFGYAMSWISAVIGLSVKSVEVAQSAGLIWMFPLTFLSNAFVPTDTLPSVLQPVAEWNPISSVVLALRELWGNAPSGAANGSGFPAEHPIELAVGWCLLILVIFMPWAIARYRRPPPADRALGIGRRRRPAGVTAPAAAGQARAGAGAAPRRRPRARARGCAADLACPGRGPARAGVGDAVPRRRPWAVRGVRWAGAVRVPSGPGRRGRENAPCCLPGPRAGCVGRPLSACCSAGAGARGGTRRAASWSRPRAEGGYGRCRVFGAMPAGQLPARGGSAAAHGLAFDAGSMPKRRRGTFEPEHALVRRAPWAEGDHGRRRAWCGIRGWLSAAPARRWLVATGPTTARAGPMWSVGGAACAFVGCRWGTRA